MAVSPPEELTLTEEETLPPADRTVMPCPRHGWFLLLSLCPFAPALADPWRLPAVTETLCAAAEAARNPPSNAEKTNSFLLMQRREVPLSAAPLPPG